MESRWRRRSSWSPGRIVGVYATVALLWILFSDVALSLLVPDPTVRQEGQTAKGAAFVLVTSALLYALIRRSDRTLRAMAAELRATVDSIADAVLVVDGSGRIVEVNRAAVELYQVASKDELLGLSLGALVQRFRTRAMDGTPLSAEQLAVARALAGEAEARLDALVRRASGEDVAVSVSAARVQGGGEGLVVAVLRDVSAARRLEEVREEFLATAAHELKTPLAVIKAYAQLLDRRQAAERQPLQVIQRQVDRLDRLLQQLLTASRLRLEGDLRRERVDLAAVAAEVVARLRPAAPAHVLSVEAGAPAPVLADRAALDRVVASLLDNAVRFSPTGGPVRVLVEVRDGVAAVSVADRGVGIPPEKQARLFERYYRAHAGTAEDYGGLGLGLEVSRGIVERLGGRMSVESKPGEGSTFRFTIPLAPEARA